MVYDVTDRNSFEHITMWLNELEVYATNGNIVKMLVGNKIDKGDRTVTQKEGVEFARDKAMLFIEASAKDTTGVKQAFDEVTQKILDTPDLWGAKAAGGVSLGGGSADDDQAGCCY